MPPELAKTMAGSTNWGCANPRRRERDLMAES